jgi:tetratricopeptide (TPR) repeat protein
VEEALEEFAAMTAQNTDPEETASLLLNEARCCHLLGRFAEARERLSRAYAIAPRTQGLLYLELENAFLLSHEGERHKALGTLERLIADYGPLVASREHRVLFEQVTEMRGTLLADLGRYKEAAPLLEQCLSFDPRTTEMIAVAYYLGLCSLKLGKSAEAKERFQEVLRTGGRTDLTTMAHLYLGNIYFDEAAYAKALMEFEWCLNNGEGGPTKKYLYKWLAVTAKALGMRGDAQRYEKLAKP